MRRLLKCSLSKMRKTIPIIFVVVMLIAGFQMCFGDGLPLSITKSNENVILTWPQTSNWVLVATSGLDYCYVSNDVMYCEAYLRHTISSANFRTNGTNFSVVLPLDFTMNQFYLLQTNDFPPLPPPSLQMRTQSQTIIEPKKNVRCLISR
jgi:hypothetical protein